MHRVLVTGGAGYIGSHVVEHLISNQFDVTVVDDLSSGNSRFLRADTHFIKGSILNDSILEEVFDNKKKDRFVGVIHLAGIKYASESVNNPAKFYDINSMGTLKIISKMLTNGIKNLVFASSCSVYGQPLNNPVVYETTDLHPISPYGKSKLIAESVINAAVNMGDLNAISLRYFNVIGSQKGQITDLSPFNLLPNIYRAISDGKPLKVYGSNLNTPDGTAIRDYVNVENIAQMHVESLMKLISGKELNRVYNLGSEQEISINQIISTAISVIAPFKVDYFDLRPGDPERIVANCVSARKDLNWTHSSTLEDMILSGWEAWNLFHEKTSLSNI